MRPVLIGDVQAAALALAALPVAARDAALDRMFARAAAADRFRKRLGRVHPAWGDGTLAAAARAGAGGRGAAAEAFLCDPRYLDGLLRVLGRLAARRGIAPPVLPL